MFDFGRIAEAVTSLVGSSVASGQTDIMQHLEALGVDPAMLQGLDAGQLTELLSQYGIDASTLDAGQLTDLLGQLGSSSDLLALSPNGSATIVEYEATQTHRRTT